MKKILSAILAGAMMLSMAISAGAADIKDTAKTLALGKSVSGKMGTFTYDGQKDYKITVTQKGVLNLTYETIGSHGLISVYDSDDRYLVPSEIDTIQGTISKNSDSMKCWINDVSKKHKSIFSYEVKKGTYYVRVVSYNTQDIEYKLSAKMASTVSEPMLIMTLAKGDTITLGNTFEEADEDADVTWKSSKKSIATVSSSGKIKAVAKGTAIITATCGDETVQIKIKVTA